MNYSTAIFLVNANVRAVLTSYETPDPVTNKPTGKLTMYKTTDRTVKPGDMVLVPTTTRHKMTVVRVEEVDVEVDLESGVQVDWLIGHAPNRDAYNALVTTEADGIAQIKSAEKKAKQDELRAKLLADNPALAALGDVTAMALPPPVPEVAPGSFSSSGPVEF